jgi:hypothetical protein
MACDGLAMVTCHQNDMSCGKKLPQTDTRQARLPPSRVFYFPDFSQSTPRASDPQAQTMK